MEQDIITGIDMLRQIRSVVKREVANISEEQLLVIPKGFRNNILWNAGHLVVTQQILCYKLSGQEMYVGADLLENFRKGTSPADWKKTPDIQLVLDLLVKLPERVPEDYAAGRFEDFQEYQTATGPLLRDFREAVAFNNFHEGLHTGIIRTMKRLVA